MARIAAIWPARRACSAGHRARLLRAGGQRAVRLVTLEVEHHGRLQRQPLQGVGAARTAGRVLGGPLQRLHLLIEVAGAHLAEGGDCGRSLAAGVAAEHGLVVGTHDGCRGRRQRPERGQREHERPPTFHGHGTQQPPLTAGMTKTEAPSVSGVVRPPVSRMSGRADEHVHVLTEPALLVEDALAHSGGQRGDRGVDRGGTLDDELALPRRRGAGAPGSGP